MSKKGLLQALSEKGDLSLLGQVADLEESTIVSVLCEIISKFILPSFNKETGAVGEKQFLEYLGYLDKVLTPTDVLENYNRARALLANLCSEIYGKLDLIGRDGEFPSLINVQNHLLRMIIDRWAETAELEEAQTLFMRVVCVVEKSNEAIISSIKKKVQEVDHKSSLAKISLAISTINEHLPNESLMKLLTVVANRWTKTLEAEQILFLSEVNRQFETTPMLAEQKAVIEATKRIVVAGEFAREVIGQLLTANYEAEVMTLAPDNICLKIIIYSDPDYLIQIEGDVLSFLSCNEFLTRRAVAKGFVCHLCVSTKDGSVSSSGKTWVPKK